jgi:hypothetical protein
LIWFDCLEDIAMRINLFRSGIIAAVVALPVIAFASNAPATGTTAPATAAATSPAHVDARYATPISVIKTLALAIKAGNGRSIRQCMIVQGSAGRAAVAAFANISSASEQFTQTAITQLGPPPANMATAFGSIDASMNRLMALLPKAVVTVHKALAKVTFPASSTGKGQTIFVRQFAGGWKVDGARLLHLDQPALTAKAVRHRARQLNLLAAALNQTSYDIKTGKVKTWAKLAKDMELHILESEAAMDASRQAQPSPSAMAASPPPPSTAK